MSFNDRTSEQEILGHALVTGETHGLTTADFDGEDHRAIWLAIETLVAKGKPITIQGVLSLIKNKNVSALYLDSLTDKYLPNMNVDIRLKSLREARSKRDLLLTSNIIRDRLSEPTLTTQEIAEYMIESGKRIARLGNEGQSLSQEIREIIASQKGHISVTDVTQSVTKRHTSRDSVRKLMNRFKNEGLLEPTDKAGVYRIVNLDIEEIDWMNVKDNEIDFRWPMRIEQWFKLMPKNIVIVAGEPDSGKTAFLLNVAALNMKNFKIKYFSSEMGALELRSRLEQFALVEDDPEPMKLEDWANENFKVYERVTNFADVVDPYGVNIIDFMEIHNEFYRVSEYIREIFDKLITGVAIIAIQKNRGAEWGLGGQRTIEKARLAVNLNNNGYAHSAQLIKVKNWRNPKDNPNYMKMDYSLVRGCYFKSLSSWVKEYPEQKQGDRYEQGRVSRKVQSGTRTEVHPKRNGSAERFNRNFGEAEE